MIILLWYVHYKFYMHNMRKVRQNYSHSECRGRFGIHIPLAESMSTKVKKMDFGV